MINTDNQDEEVPLTFEGIFLVYCNYAPKQNVAIVEGNKQDWDRILLSQADVWMMKAGMIGKNLTLTETGVHFSKFKKWRLNFEEFLEYLDDICKTKNLDINYIKEDLFNAGVPTTTDMIKII